MTDPQYETIGNGPTHHHTCAIEHGFNVGTCGETPRMHRAPGVVVRIRERVLDALDAVGLVEPFERLGAWWWSR